MRKKIFIAIIIVFNLILLEFACFFLIKPIQLKYSNVEKYLNISGNIKDKIISKEYRSFIPYLRSKDQYDDKEYITLIKEQDYFFNQLQSFSKKKKLNILIQGDSWGESLNMKDVFKTYSDVSKKNNFGLINASISSYSITPYYHQVKILYNQFGINPNIVILIFDQTDIGDELYRYNTFLNKDQNILFEYFNNKIYTDLSINNLNSVKIFLFLKNFYLKEKNRYNYSHFQNVNNICKKLFFRFFIKTPIVLTPLTYGINGEEKLLISKVIENYINAVFNNKEVEKLFFVIHPLKKHTTGEYKFSNRLILKDVINKSKYKNKIRLVDFFNKPINSYEFKKNDIFSHPTKKYYKNKFWPTIFEKILN